MDLGLQGKVAVVTGASSGIGLEVSRRLCAAGALVLMVARGEERLVRAADELGAEYLCADITDPDCDERIVATCEEQMGEIDVLVNNAGTSSVRALEDLTDEDWLEQYDINVMAPMRLMRAAAPKMASRGWGRIVNVASSSGKRPSLRDPAYSVTKAAELSLSRVFADAYAGTGVLVNAVAPGLTATGLWLEPGQLADQSAAAQGKTREAVLNEAAAKQPIGRVAQPGEIADVIVFLCSERASYVMGAAWSADGGAVPTIV